MDAYFTAAFVPHRVLDTGLFMQSIGAFDCNLCFFRLAWMWRLDNLFDESEQGGVRSSDHISVN